MKRKYPKIQLSDSQIALLQKLVKENVSYSEMGRQLNRSIHTIQRFIKDYNIDMSEYDPINKKRGHRAIKPTKEELTFIQNSINSGMGKLAIAKKLKISPEAFNNICNFYHIDMSKYMRKGNRTKILTKQEQIKLQAMLDNKIKYCEIANYFKINRNLIPTLIKRYNLNVEERTKPIEYSFSSKEQSLILEMLNIGFSYRNMASCLGKTLKTMKTYMANHDIKIESRKNIKDIRLIAKYAILCSKMNDLSFPDDLTVDTILMFPTMISKYPFSELAKKWNIDWNSLKRIIHACGWSKLISIDAFADYSYSKQFDTDMINPELSSTTIGIKYGLKNNTISTYRNKYYGDIKYRTNVFLNKSTAEIKFESILRQIDLTFFYQEEICGYRVDYYLGQKLIVEIQGDYWHNKKRAIQSDKKKKEKLSQNGYHVLQIWEHDLDNDIEKVADTVISAYISLLLKK